MYGGLVAYGGVGGVWGGGLRIGGRAGLRMAGGLRIMVCALGETLKKLILRPSQSCK